MTGDMDHIGISNGQSHFWSGVLKSVSNIVFAFKMLYQFKILSELYHICCLLFVNVVTFDFTDPYAVISFLLTFGLINAINAF